MIYSELAMVKNPPPLLMFQQRLKGKQRSEKALQEGKTGGFSHDLIEGCWHRGNFKQPNQKWGIHVID